MGKYKHFNKDSLMINHEEEEVKEDDEDRMIKCVI